MKATNYLSFDPTTGAIIGNGYTPDGTIPPSCIACTDAQASAPSSWAVNVSTSPVALVAAPMANQLGIAAEIQRMIIKSDYLTEQAKPVTDANGVIWSGGQDSGTAIYLAIQLAQAGGSTNITLYDLENLPHVLSIADGMKVASVIGTAVQEAYQHMQAQKKAINDIVSANGTVAQIQAIVW